RGIARAYESLLLDRAGAQPMTSVRSAPPDDRRGDRGASRRAREPCVRVEGGWPDENIREARYGPSRSGRWMDREAREPAPARYLPDSPARCSTHNPELSS